MILETSEVFSQVHVLRKRGSVFCTASVAGHSTGLPLMGTNACLDS